MCIHCLKKEARKADEVIDLILGDGIENRLAQCSRTKAWDEAPPSTPYLDMNKLKRRSKKRTKQVAKVFRIWEKRFLQNLKEAKGQGFFFFAKQEEISLEVWETQVLVGVTDPNEMNDVLIDIVDDELPISAKEVEKNLFKIHAVTIEGANVPPQETIAFLEKYEFELSQSTAEQVDRRLKSIVINGVAQGHSIPRMTKDIRSHFKTLKTSRAEMIARTETIRASAEGSKTSYVNAGIEKVAVLPALSACPICMGIASDNPYDVDDPQAYAPFHPSCRCTAVPVFSESDVEAISTGVVERESFV